MIKNRWIVALFALVFASLACNLVSGAKSTPVVGSAARQPATPAGKATAVEATRVESPTASEAGAKPTQTASAGEQPGSKNYHSEFALPDDVSQFTDMGNGTVNFQTGLSITDALAFYREAFAKAGYKERAINTSISETTFSLVFDGHSSGKAIVIQAVDLGNGKTNINIRLEGM